MLGAIAVGVIDAIAVTAIAEGSTTVLDYMGKYGPGEINE